MKWTVTISAKEYTDYDGVVHDAATKTFECPFEYYQDVYYVYREKKPFRKARWVARKSRVSSIWATNIFGVRLDNGEWIDEDMFYRLFTDKEEAIEFCLKKNQHSQIKIYD